MKIKFLGMLILHFADGYHKTSVHGYSITFSIVRLQYASHVIGFSIPDVQWYTFKLPGLKIF